MSKSPRKSIVASFGLLSAELENSLAAQPQAESSAPASPAPALPDDEPQDFEALKRSMEADEQKVPVQVRRHPAAPGRYQIVYGHRRLRAAKELGLPVRAIEVDISDLDLVVAQGTENANRQDLTWIEPALFAARMDEAGIKPRDIYAALSIEDAELVRMRSVYRAVPVDVIEAIGRAPKIGRPCWLEFTRIIAAEPEALEAVRTFLSLSGSVGCGSDQRFQRKRLVRLLLRFPANT